MQKPDYGIDAPGVVRNLIVIGVAMIVMGFFFSSGRIGSVRIDLHPMLLIWGGIFVAEGMAMLLYSKIGKFYHRDRILNRVNWRGDEQVLDVGTGRGVLMNGAAKRLQNGKAYGIDIWSQKDLSSNAMVNTYRNAELEGVRERVELLSEDATKMSFADASFDVVVSNLCLHNIPSAAGRAQACREIARVLKPGGASP